MTTAAAWSVVSAGGIVQSLSSVAARESTPIGITAGARAPLSWTGRPCQPGQGPKASLAPDTGLGSQSNCRGGAGPARPDPTTKVDELWQAGFTYFRIIVPSSVSARFKGFPSRTTPISYSLGVCIMTGDWYVQQHGSWLFGSALLGLGVITRKRA